jgi:hypothetical protein
MARPQCDTSLVNFILMGIFYKLLTSSYSSQLSMKNIGKPTKIH